MGGFREKPCETLRLILELLPNCGGVFVLRHHYPTNKSKISHICQMHLQAYWLNATILKFKLFVVRAHNAAFFTFPIAGLFGISFVMLLFAFGKANLNFNAAFCKVHI